MMKTQNKRAGFTIMELVVVMMISGLIIGGAAQMARIHLAQQKQTEVNDKMERIVASLEKYQALYGHYPCPANPTLPETDPNAGQEFWVAGGFADCLTAAAAIPADTCVGGICRITGRVVNNPPSPPVQLYVLTGGYPYQTIVDDALLRTANNPLLRESLSDIASANDAVDPWGGRMSYLVTEGMTDRGSYESSYGAVAVQTETGVSLVDPAETAHFAVISHGNNNSGAYDINGVQTACPAAGASADVENCDGDYTVTAGLTRLGTGAAYFDDAVYFLSSKVTNLWSAVPVGDWIPGRDYLEDEFVLFNGSYYVATVDHTADTTNGPNLIPLPAEWTPISVPPTHIYNVNPGFVGVGTGTPQESLDITNATAAGGLHTWNDMMSDQICDRSGGATDCFNPEDLGGNIGMQCPARTATQVYLARRFRNGGVECDPVTLPAAIIRTACAPGELMYGVDILGGVLCAPPP